MIDFTTDSRLSFDQMKDKYNLTIGEVMRLYCEWRNKQ